VERRGLDPRDAGVRATVGAEYAADHPRPRAVLAEVADHVEHVRTVAGIDHVGIGGDFDGADDVPDGLQDVACYPALIAELLDRGWSRDECVQVIGGNVLRALREAEALSRSLSARRIPSTARIEDLDRADRPPPAG
jgi:membrane dipeptidase